MPPRNRKPENKDLEPNLYPEKKKSGTYYTYIHPIDGWREPLGKDKKEANRVSRALNMSLERSGIDPKKRVAVVKGQTVGHIVDQFMAIKLATLKPGGSRKSGKNFMVRLKKLFDKRPIRALTVLEMREAMEDLEDSSYIKMRQLLIEVFDFALSQGYLHHSYGNPAEVLARRREPKRKRRRLTLAEFKAIYNQAPPWLRLAMGIFLHTGMRPGDIVNLTFTQFDGSNLKTLTQKTGKGLKIELSENVRGLISAARDDIASPYIVHRMPERKGRKSKFKQHPTQLTVDELSRSFRLIRNSLGIDDDRAPSFYEIRSLCSRTYEEQGYDIKTIQALLAHTSEKMTKVYLENEQEVIYSQVYAGLSVKL